jgi:hypothetical protein
VHTLARCLLAYRPVAASQLLASMVLLSVPGYCLSSSGFDLRVTSSDPRTGQPLEIIIQRPKDNGRCAVEVNYGDGESKSLRIDDEKESVSDFHTYKNAGTYQLAVISKAQVRGLKTAYGCIGPGIKTQIVVKDGGVRAANRDVSGNSTQLDAGQSLSTTVGAIPSYTKRVALVIGNSKYTNAALSNPANDARDVSSSLRKLGFEVTELIDATQKDMNRAIAQFGSRLTSQTVAMFFFAGHGLQVKGKNYLVPIDAVIEAENAVRAETVDVDTVLDQLSVSPLNVVVLDACRNNPFERRFRSTGGGLAQMDAPKGTLIAYATAPGKIASDGDGRNGLYTQELLKHIQTPGLSIETVFKRVRNGVMSASADNQTPWESSSLTGDFYFAAPGTANSAPQQDPRNLVASKPVPPSPTKTTAQIEDEVWNSVKDTSDPSLLEEYLVQYPKGRYAPLARTKIKKIKTESEAKIEDDLWSVAKTSGELTALETYVSKYPSGRYASEARKKITEERKRVSKPVKSASSETSPESQVSEPDSIFSVISSTIDNNTRITIQEAAPTIHKIIAIHQCIRLTNNTRENDQAMRRLNFLAEPGIDFAAGWRNTAPMGRMQYHDQSKCVPVKAINKISMPARNALRFTIVYFAEDSGEVANFTYLLMKSNSGDWRLREFSQL